MKLLRHVLIVIGFAGLAACGGGAPTVGNPPPVPPLQSDYNGPPPEDADTQSFRIAFWQNVKDTQRCGGCHNASTPAQPPLFARNDDVNLAYAAAQSLVNRTQPDQSALVLKVAGGHNCWLASEAACADILTTWIQNWVGAMSGGGTVIALAAPTNDVEVGESITFPENPADFEATVYPVLRGMTQGNCQRCHAPSSPSPAPGSFASADVVEAYAAARSKINLDNAANSRFVERLRDENHNCWEQPTNCAASASVMLGAIEDFIGRLEPVEIDDELLISRALTLVDGIVAAGGNRYEDHTIAKYQFKELTDGVLFDTSGVEPALNLNVSGDITHMGGWGINIGALGGKAQGTTTASRKLAQHIKLTGEYTLEAWAAPANVTQEDAWIVSYSANAMSRNFTLGQRAYQYEALNRSSTTGANGAPALLTNDDDRDAQASLQHIVLTYDPINGRRLYVNGNFTGDADPRDGGEIGDWDDAFALVLGNETSNNRQWRGAIRFVAIHERALNLEQIQMNFAAGVGQRYYLLFNVTALTGVPQSFVMFEASQYDSYSYLFTRPTFISLDPAVGNTTPLPAIPIQGIRIGVNGSEAQAGQAYANLDMTVNDTAYTPDGGQSLADIGTVIGLQKGPVADQFFLTFDRIGDNTYARTPLTGATPVAVELPARSDIGVRTFEQLNQSMSRITGVATTNTGVRQTYLQVQQQLPPVPDIEAFLASHQTGVAQLAIKYCSEMVNNATLRTGFFGAGLNVAASPATQFADPAGKDILIVPLLQKAVGTVIASQPSDTEIRTELSLLIDRLAIKPGATSANVAKAVCAAALGSGVLSIL